MFRIRRFGVMKTATVVAVMYMVIVAIFVVPFRAHRAAHRAVAGFRGRDDGRFGLVIVGAVAILAYGLIGWIFTALAAAVYNLAAGWVGGIEVQVETVAPPPPPAGMGYHRTTTASGPAGPTAPPSSSV